MSRDGILLSFIVDRIGVEVKTRSISTNSMSDSDTDRVSLMQFSLCISHLKLRRVDSPVNARLVGAEARTSHAPSSVKAGREQRTPTLLPGSRDMMT